MDNNKHLNVLKTWLEFTYSKLTGRKDKSKADIFWFILFAFIVILTMSWLVNLFIKDVESVIHNVVLLSITILMLGLIWQYIFRKPPNWIQKIMPIIGFILIIVFFGIIVLIVIDGKMSLISDNQNWNSQEPLEEFKNDTQNHSINTPNMVRIQGGTYKIGLSEKTLKSLVEEKYANHEDFSNEIPQIKITVNDFEISKYEISVKQFNDYLKYNKIQINELDEKIYADDKPIVNVTWYDANNYCLWLSQITGEKYRLPYEIEWEIASKGNSENIYSWGNDIPNKNYCNYKYSFINSTISVGKMPLNQSVFGVVNMSGNVAEWCSDWYHSNHYRLIKGDSIICLEQSQNKVIRGGGWNSVEFYLRSTARYYALPSSKSDEIGFRIVKILN